MEYAPIRQRAGRRPALTTLPPTLGLWLVAAFAIVLIGAATAGATAGSMLWALLLACSCIAATFLVLGVLGFPTLLAWPVLTGIAYPFLRYPTLSPIVTFDRIWIIGLLGAITFAVFAPAVMP